MIFFNQSYGILKFKKIKTINDWMPLFLPYTDKLWHGIDIGLVLWWYTETRVYRVGVGGGGGYRHFADSHTTISFTNYMIKGPTMLT